MKAKNKFLTALILSAGAATTIAAINKYIKIHATSRNLLAESEPLCYKWRFGNIHYTKIGSGKPLLLIHDLNASSSGYEWNRLIPFLQNHYTIYTIDLLGCGRSEKASMTYTNYLYVQLISDFIKNVIGHRTCVVATGESASIPIMACSNDPDLFDQLLLINPLSLLEYSQIPGRSAKLYKLMVEAPVVGTLLYHIATSKKAIAEDLVNRCFYNPYSVKPLYIESYYEAAHLGSSPKSVYISHKCNYTKCNITNALKKIDNSIYLVGGGAIDNNEELLEEYKKYNSSIETIMIPETRALPQLEAPEKLAELVCTYIN